MTSETPIVAGERSPAKPFIERMNGIIAVAGGLVMLAVALLVTASVVMRWLYSSPIDGDFEFVQMATAIAIFAFLPYTQARRGNIMVDTFTGWLPTAWQRVLDAVWDLAYAALMGYVAYALVHGSLNAFRSGETTMQRQLVLWPSVALCAALAGLVAVTALATALRLANAASKAGKP